MVLRQNKLYFAATSSVIGQNIAAVIEWRFQTDKNPVYFTLTEIDVRQVSGVREDVRPEEIAESVLPGQERERSVKVYPRQPVGVSTEGAPCRQTTASDDNHTRSSIGTFH